MGPSYIVRNRPVNKFFVALGYLLVEAMLMVVGGLLFFASAIGIAQHAGAPLIIGKVIGGTLWFGFAAFTIVYALRDYRRSVSGHVTLDMHKLALPTLRGQLEIPLSEIESMRIRKDGHGVRLAIRLASGKRHVFPRWFSNAPDMSDAIQNTIVPAIAERLASAVHQGAEIQLTENRFAACWRFVFGLFMTPVALICILRLRWGVGLGLMRDSIGAICAGARGMRRNLVLDAAGLRRGATRLSWTEIETIHADGFGAVIRTGKGKRWHISMYIDNFLPLHFLVASLSDSRPRASSSC